MAYYDFKRSEEVIHPDIDKDHLGCYVCGRSSTNYIEIRTLSHMHSESLASFFNIFGLSVLPISLPSVTLVGACTKHQENLEKLTELTKDNEEIDPSILIKSLTV